MQQVLWRNGVLTQTFLQNAVQAIRNEPTECRHVTPYLPYRQAEGAAAIQPINATSHWLHGEAAGAVVAAPVLR